MGLFDNNDEVAREMEEKNAEIAMLRRELAAKSNKKSKIVPKGKDETSEDEVDERSTHVRSVTIKLPPFSESNPELWFAKAESQFKLKGITSDTTKFHHLYALMTDKAANEIEAILLNPPKEGKVEAMKSKLVRRFGRSQYDKNTELLGIRTLGDLKPSEMWSKFQRLNKDPCNATSSFVRDYLINMYPPEVRGVLANMTFADNDEMVEAADRYLENAKKRPGEVNAVQTSEVQEDFGHVDAISRGPKGRGSTKAGRGGPGGQKPPAQYKTCFFHDRHGLDAFKCNGPPCPFSTAPLAKQSGNATAGR